MTKEEAIRILKNINLSGVYHELICLCDTDSEAISMAIKALEQLDIIRCKDCKYACIDIVRESDEIYCSYMEFYPHDEFYCGWAERKSDE